MVHLEQNLEPISQIFDIQWRYGNSSERIATLWSYDPTDPYALSVGFRNSYEGELNTWTFARSLALGGLVRQTGLGDVQFSPLKRHVAMHLSSPDGTADFLVPRGKLVGFLGKTYARVPRSAESELQEPRLEIAVDLLLQDGDWLT